MITAAIKEIKIKINDIIAAAAVSGSEQRIAVQVAAEGFRIAAATA